VAQLLNGMGCLMALSGLPPWRSYLGGTALAAFLVTGSKTPPSAWFWSQ